MRRSSAVLSSRARHSLAVGAILAAGLVATGASHAAPEVGAPAPAFAAVDSKGQSVNLADFKGKTVVLEWTNHDCPYVKKHYNTGNMQALQKDATGEGVVWLSVISSAPGLQGHVDGTMADKLTAKRDAAPTHVLLDPDGVVGTAYDARTTPQMFVINAEGKLAYMGAIDNKPTTRTADVETADNYLRGALAAVAEGRAADPAVTRPYGCSVKYGS